MFYFTVLGKIKGKARPRFTRSGHVFTPTTTKRYENLIQDNFFLCERIAVDPKSAVEISIEAYFEPPKSLSKKKQQALYNTLYTKKPDVDNVIKVVLDALNGIAYCDDKQVVKVSLCKSYIMNEYDEERLVIGINYIDMR